MSSKQTPPTNFLNGPNYQKIVGFLRQRYTQKLGMNAIPERMDTRLQKTVQHYMTEIARAQSGLNVAVQSLNQEVLKETTSSIDNWLKKQESSAAPSVVSIGTPSRQDDYSRLFEDSNTRFDSIQASRASASSAPPPVPAFRAQDSLELEEDPVILMQRMQKSRDEQARALGIPTTNISPPKLEIREEVSPSAMNPVPPQAESAPALLAPRPQEYIIPQEDIVKYRETEYNIFLTSSDRDWLRNTTETRYNFTVNFNTGSKRIGFPYNASLQERFRNIQRIEFVKAIIPIESLTMLPRLTYYSSATVLNYYYDLTRVINVFSLPFVGIRISELNNNGFSTKPEEDNTFAIVQYDTTWSSDLNAPNNNVNSHGLPNSAPLAKSGYTGLIPKFLKTQKVYTPTPLATLQKLSIRMERHSGDLLSEDSDVWFIKRICMSGWSGTTPLSSIASAGVAPNTLYRYQSTLANPQNSYIYIQTNKYFPFSAVSEGDTILFQGYTPTATGSAALDFQTYINQAAGHVVVATGYVNTTTNLYYDGRNNQGYCNVIIIQNRFDDPSLGSVSRTGSTYFGGSDSIEQTFAGYLNQNNSANPNYEPDQTNAALINLSRQSHIVLRVITRDMDSSTNIRPDNV